MRKQHATCEVLDCGVFGDLDVDVSWTCDDDGQDIEILTIDANIFHTVNHSTTLPMGHSIIEKISFASAVRAFGMRSIMSAIQTRIEENKL